MRYLYTITILFVFLSCNTLSTEKPGALVPPTANKDPYLPQLEITVAGHTRTLHLQTFGSPADLPVFVLHGGPGADFRLLLPLKALADHYYVVMWDSRGAGLSERVTKEELSIESFDDEISEIRKALVPNRKITLIGHSFGGNIVTHYTAKHPEKVASLILIEPGKLDLSINIDHNGGVISFLDGQDFFWQNEILTSSDHASADYKAIALLPKSSRNWTCDNSLIENYPFWRFGAYHYYVVQKNKRKLPDDFNWAVGIEDFEGPITIIAGTCGAASEGYQRKTNLITLPNANFKVIKDANHLSLLTEFQKETVAAVRSALQ